MLLLIVAAIVVVAPLSTGLGVVVKELIDGAGGAGGFGGGGGGQEHCRQQRVGFFNQ